MDKLSLTETTYTEELYQITPLTAVVLDSKWNDLSDAEKELLTKILHSIRLTLAAVRLVEEEKLDLSAWHQKPRRLIGFGINIPGVVSYEPITTPETNLILADSLSTLLNSDDLKKKLWIGLKKLFLE